jgi:CheY-like chemotaxis protein
LVLVVDAEPAIRILARRILEGSGYDVIDAGNGAEALAIVATNRPVDFLIADLDMPVMRGDKMARTLRQLRPDLGILYVTAQSERLFEERPELSAREAFLDKPFTVRGLLEAVSLLRNGFITEPSPPSSTIRRLWNTWAGSRMRVRR